MAKLTHHSSDVDAGSDLDASGDSESPSNAFRSGPETVVETITSLQTDRYAAGARALRPDETLHLVCHEHPGVPQREIRGYIRLTAQVWADFFDAVLAGTANAADRPDFTSIREALSEQGATETGHNQQQMRMEPPRELSNPGAIDTELTPTEPHDVPPELRQEALHTSRQKQEAHVRIKSHSMVAYEQVHIETLERIPTLCTRLHACDAGLSRDSIYYGLETLQTIATESVARDVFLVAFGVRPACCIQFGTMPEQCYEALQTVINALGLSAEYAPWASGLFVARNPHTLLELPTGDTKPVQVERELGPFLGYSATVRRGHCHRTTAVPKNAVEADTAVWMLRSGLVSRKALQYRTLVPPSHGSTPSCLVEAVEQGTAISSLFDSAAKKFDVPRLRPLGEP